MGGGGYSVLVNYQALQLKYRSISLPPPSLFSIIYRRYRYDIDGIWRIGRSFQTPVRAPPQCRFLVTRQILNVRCYIKRAYFQVVESYNEKLLVTIGEGHQGIL